MMKFLDAATARRNVFGRGWNVFFPTANATQGVSAASVIGLCSILRFPTNGDYAARCGNFVGNSEGLAAGKNGKKVRKWRADATSALTISLLEFGAR